MGKSIDRDASRTSEGYADRSTRFPDDRLLRFYGFRIWRRPKHGRAVWTRGGEVFGEDEALALVRKNNVEVVR